PDPGPRRLHPFRGPRLSLNRGEPTSPPVRRPHCPPILASHDRVAPIFQVEKIASSAAVQAASGPTSREQAPWKMRGARNPGEYWDFPCSHAGTLSQNSTDSVENWLRFGLARDFVRQRPPVRRPDCPTSPV